MLRLIGKEENTKYTIFTLIYNSEQGLTISQLAQALEINVKTMKIYLDDLGHYLNRWSPDVQIAYENKRYSIKCAANFNIEHIYSSMKKEAAFFDLYHYHFTGKFRGVRQFSTEYYCSSSRVYSHLTKMRDLLRPYQIDLGTSMDGHGLIGDEQQIRFHTFHYYWEIYKGIEWPFDLVLEKECYIQIEELSRALNVTLSLVEKKQLMLWLAISKTRIKLSKSVRLNVKICDLLMNSDFGKRNLPVICEFFKGDKLESLFFLFVFFVTCKRFLLLEDIHALLTEKQLAFCSEVKQKFFSDSLSLDESNQYNALILEGIYYHQYLSIGLLLEDEKKANPLEEIVVGRFKETLMKYELNSQRDDTLARYFGKLFASVVEHQKILLPVKVKFLLSDRLTTEYAVKKRLTYFLPNLVFCSPMEPICDVVITDLVSDGSEMVDSIYFNGRNELEWDRLEQLLLQRSIIKNEQDLNNADIFEAM